VAPGDAVWELSEAILRIDRSEDYPVTVYAVDGDHVHLSQDPDTVKPIPFGLVWPGGHAVLTSTVTPGPGRVGRTISSMTRGSLLAGTMADFDCHVFAGDPRTAHGLDFDEPVIDGELGGMPAWQVPPQGTRSSRGTWVIAVHGRGVSRDEALRILPTLSESGVTTLVVSYRNDVAAPPSPDGYCHLGEDEWRDVAAAIRYVRDQGARKVVLYGWSMGAMLTLTALRRLAPDQASAICGVILDSPLLDWRATLSWQARQRGISQPLARKAARLAERRASISRRALDQVGYGWRLTVPVLLFADTADRTVPAQSAQRFARRHPGQVSLVTTGSGHGRCWNEDPLQYEAAVRAFLHAPSGGGHAGSPPA
jgi:pimeloyl-ACP methyl ester carboxylesterase